MPGESGVRTAAVNGIALAYREQGEGEAVVFVHGSASDLRSWEQQLPAIGTRYRAIAYSRRYARPNEDIEPGADDQMLPHVDDLAALLRVTGATPAHLVGHSWGAFICLLAAIRHPETVRSLVLLEPPVVSLFVTPRRHSARSSPCSPGGRGPRWRSSGSAQGRSHPRNGPSGEAMTIRRSRRSRTVCSAGRHTSDCPRNASSRRARTWEHCARSSSAPASRDWTRKTCGVSVSRPC